MPRLLFLSFCGCLRILFLRSTVRSAVFLLRHGGVPIGIFSFQGGVGYKSYPLAVLHKRCQNYEREKKEQKVGCEYKLQSRIKYTDSAKGKIEDEISCAKALSSKLRKADGAVIIPAYNG